VQRLSAWNRRSLDALSSKLYFYYARAHELAERFAEIRPYVIFGSFVLFFAFLFKGSF
jgi:26S proteasome regulatory subunit N3